MYKTYCSLSADAVPFSDGQWLLWHPERAYKVMKEMAFPAQIFAQCVLRTLHPITPAVSSIWFLLPSVYMFTFSCFPIFVMISRIENNVVRVLLYSVDPTPSSSLNDSSPVELWCIYKNNIWSLKIVVSILQIAGKSQRYFSFKGTYISLSAMQNPWKLE